MLVLYRELISRVKLCLVIVFPAIIKDCPKIRNIPKIFLRSFENVGLVFDLHRSAPTCCADMRRCVFYMDQW